MSVIGHRPLMSNAPCEPVVAATASDEYGHSRKLHVAQERPLTIYLNRQEVVTLMTLGTEPEFLVLGYLRNQGLLTVDSVVESVQVDWETEAAAVVTADGEVPELPDTHTVTTGCGQGTVYGDMREAIAGIKLQMTTPLPQSQIYDCLRSLGQMSKVYSEAGSVHGCALCYGTSVRYFVEDVGRHNAVDAIAGQMWLDGSSGQDCWFYTTGRLTSEIVMKVAMMGVPILLSRSGLTNMGLELALETGMTMVARAQGKHFLIYCGSENIELDVPLPRKNFVSHSSS